MNLGSFLFVGMSVDMIKHWGRCNFNWNIFVLSYMLSRWNAWFSARTVLSCILSRKVLLEPRRNLKNWPLQLFSSILISSRPLKTAGSTNMASIHCWKRYSCRFRINASTSLTNFSILNKAYWIFYYCFPTFWSQKMRPITNIFGRLSIIWVKNQFWDWNTFVA